MDDNMNKSQLGQDTPMGGPVPAVGDATPMQQPPMGGGMDPMSPPAVSPDPSMPPMPPATGEVSTPPVQEPGSEMPKPAEGGSDQTPPPSGM